MFDIFWFVFSFPAGMILATHYECIQDLVAYCPVTVLCGKNHLGKSKSASVALSLLGSNKYDFFTSVKERFVPKLLTRSTLPPVFDDVKGSATVEEVAIFTYNRGKDGTCHTESTPRTCPILTVNWETLDSLNMDPR